MPSSGAPSPWRFALGLGLSFLFCLPQQPRAAALPRVRKGKTIKLLKTQIPCDNLTKLITPYQVCDGVADCRDGTDESKATCSRSFDCSQTCRVNCPSRRRGSPTRCVSSEVVCDGRADCPGGAEETRKFCLNFNCSAISPGGTPQITCPSGAGCLADRSKLCDGVKDCADGSDESRSFCKTFNCSSVGKATCPPYNGRRLGYCVDQVKLCDVTLNATCPRRTDQSAAFCSNYNCSSSTDDPGNVRVPCPTGYGCLPAGALCDGHADCPDGSDESPAFCNSRPPPDCNSSGLALCADGKACAIPYLLCNGQKGDCPNGSDEDPAFCKAFVCPWESQEKCPSGVGCQQRGTQCDGTPDCLDGSDEDPTYCRSYNCTKYNGSPYITEDLASCPGGGQCMLDVSLCNGRPDCSDGSDEWASLCIDRNCSYAGKTFCPSKKSCTYLYSLCNGVKDCPDGSDEDPAFCSTFNCSATDSVKCPAVPGFPPLCVSPDVFCDGKADCPGAGDEGLAFCKAYSCPELRPAKCSDGSRCLEDFRICDGRIDCQDGSDEAPWRCNSYNCTAHGLQPCPGGRACLANACYICSGYHPFCSDGSDQDPQNCYLRECTYPVGEYPQCWGGVGGSGLYKKKSKMLS